MRVFIILEIVYHTYSREFFNKVNIPLFLISYGTNYASYVVSRDHGKGILLFARR